jgi:hypothetical protein
MTSVVIPTSPFNRMTYRSLKFLVTSLIINTRRSLKIDRCLVVSVVSGKVKYGKTRIFDLIIYEYVLAIKLPGSEFTWDLDTGEE